MKLADIKKIDRSKLPNEDFKTLYDEIKEGTGGFDEEFIELFDSEIKEFLTAVKKYVPEALTETVKRVRQPRKKTEKPIDFEDDDVVETVMEDYNLTREKAVKLIALRKEAYELKKENLDKLLDRLDKSEFYQGKNSKAPIDKGRTRDLGKDSKQGSITLAEERKMTKTPFKRISKAGRKNQYGTTEGGKVYYEYRMNRRDVDKKIKLEKGGGVGIPNAEKRFRISIVFNDYDTNTSSTKSYFPMALNKENAKQKAIFDFKQQFPNSKILKLTFKTKFDKGGSVSIPNADKMFHLPYEIAVYVPSTKDVDKNITATELRARVKEVEKYLAETFGGFTSAEKVGGYLSSKSSVVTEKVIPVTAFATMQSFKDNKAKLVNKMSVWAKKWGQEAIGFEFEGDLYYVPQKFKTGGKLTATYIPKRDIKTLTTVWGNNIKGKDLIDGAYTVRKDIKKQPKMVRSMFEEEEFSEFKTGGLIAYSNDDYEQIVGNFSTLAEAKKFAKANKGKYETITFEDEKGDNIVVTSEDSLKDIDWLFSETYKEGGKTKPKDPVIVRGFSDDEAYEYEKGGGLTFEGLGNLELPIPILTYLPNIRLEMYNEYRDKIWTDKYTSAEKEEYFNQSQRIIVDGKRYYNIGYATQGRGMAVDLSSAYLLKRNLEKMGYKVVVEQSNYKFNPELKWFEQRDYYNVLTDKIIPKEIYEELDSKGLIFQYND
jgi:hypothetical protein